MKKIIAIFFGPFIPNGFFCYEEILILGILLTLGAFSIIFLCGIVKKIYMRVISLSFGIIALRLLLSMKFEIENELVQAIIFQLVFAILLSVIPLIIDSSEKRYKNK